MFNYILSMPDKEDTKDLPLIVFLHGAGERGDDLEQITKHGIPRHYDRLQNLPVITLSPQCERNKVWVTQIYELKALIDSVAEKFCVDKSRIALTGMSMGGFGAWELAMDFPEYFSCLVPLCGGGSAWRAETLKNIPVRAYHGEKDEVVNCFYSQDMVKAVNVAGGDAVLTLYPDLKHDCWTRTYADADVIDWMMKQKRKG